MLFSHKHSSSYIPSHRTSLPNTKLHCLVPCVICSESLRDSGMVGNTTCNLEYETYKIYRDGTKWRLWYSPESIKTLHVQVIMLFFTFFQQSHQHLHSCLLNPNSHTGCLVTESKICPNYSSLYSILRYICPTWQPTIHFHNLNLLVNTDIEKKLAQLVHYMPKMNQIN